MKKTRVLVVDDQEGFTRLLQLALPELDIRAENDPTRALVTAEEFRPELIFLDVVMPTLDGGDLAAQFKAHRTLSRVPIVFVTAIVSPKEAQTEQVIGGYPFLAKPVSKHAILACVAKHVPT